MSLKLFFTMGKAEEDKTWLKNLRDTSPKGQII